MGFGFTLRLLGQPSLELLVRPCGPIGESAYARHAQAFLDVDDGHLNLLLRHNPFPIYNPITVFEMLQGGGWVGWVSVLRLLAGAAVTAAKHQDCIAVTVELHLECTTALGRHGESSMCEIGVATACSIF